MKKNRIWFLFVLLLCTALTLGIVAFAADSATVKTGHEKGADAVYVVTSTAKRRKRFPRYLKL